MGLKPVFPLAAASALAKPASQARNHSSISSTSTLMPEDTTFAQHPLG
jgi:hypothetical protein